ncbi:MAG TPA: TonB family protein [Candidatus Limnocylindrales bacterium]|nr:TonB family protein [Candidatus Limnocylindrales bacterium]
MLWTFVVLALKSTAVLAAARLLTWAMRGRSAASRHLVWSGAFAAVLALPLLTVVLPRMAVSAPAPSLVFRSDAAAQPVTPKDAQSLPGGFVAAAPARTAAGAVGWLQLLLLAWCAGALAILARVAMAYSAIARLRRRARPYPESAEPLARRLGIAHPVAILESEAETMPMTFGVFRPAVLMPAGSGQWDAERRGMVLLHELAHVRRGDPATHLLGRFALALYWWNPLAWTAWREFLKERERAADDLVLNAGARPSEYARHLLEIARSLHCASRLDGAAIAMARGPQLEGRLLAILDSNRNRRSPRRAASVVAALAASALLMPLAAMQTQQAAPLPNVDSVIREANAKKDHELVDYVASVLKSNGQFDAAAQALQAGLQIREEQSGSGSVEYGVGLVKLGELESRRQNSKDALVYFTKAEQVLQNRPEAAPALHFLGIDALAAKKYDDAFQYFERLAAADPSQAGIAMMWMAVTREHQHDDTAAETLFQNAIATQAEDLNGAVVRSVYAAFLRGQKRVEEAQALDEQASAIRGRLRQRRQQVVAPAPAKPAQAGSGAAMTAPRLTFKQEPSYSEEARLAKYQGTVTLSVVIGENGKVTTAQVVQSLGLGLDEQAMMAVETWTFQPATKNGVPVPTQALVEVNFRLL